MRSKQPPGSALLLDQASGSRPLYVIDTSALVDAWTAYPIRTFRAAVWGRLAALAAEGRLTAPEEVRHEIGRRNPNLRAWANDTAPLFRGPDEDFVARWVRVVAECPYLVPLGRLYAADSWIVALALQLHEEEQAKLFSMPCYVITHEQRQATAGKLKIPDACAHFGLASIRFHRIFGLEGWEAE